MSRWLDAGYRDAAWLKVLRPLEWLYRAGLAHRRWAYASGRKQVERLPVPVIVVGNITLGGTGKSPLVAWLGRWLAERGWHPGIVSRGYGGRAPSYPLLVEANTPVSQAGDEPLMLAQQTGLAVMVDPDRPRGARALVELGCDILIADDGLQHLALGRDIELVVVDGRRGLGNGRCLPAGPLREPPARLAEADAVIVNGEGRAEATPRGYAMQLQPLRWRQLQGEVWYPADRSPFTGTVHAVAGIGNPARFFATLKALGVAHEEHPLADHHRFTAADLRFDDHRAVVMTAKDAVKCRGFVHERCWALDIEACPDSDFVAWLRDRLEALQTVKSEVNDG
jgi:tetraacyldisaccharide 4'-kinase